MHKILFLDTYYGQVLKKFDTIAYKTDYKSRLKKILEFKFGTADFYSKAFQSYGWDAIDVIANDSIGNRLYMGECCYAYSGDTDTFTRIILDYKPDVLYCQDLSFLPASKFSYLRNNGVKLFASQHSCPYVGDDRVKLFDIVFTSFPHYIEKIRNLGVNSEFLPIAFGGTPEWPVNVHKCRHFDATFIGGVGSQSNPLHWRNGNSALSRLCEAFPSRFKWWGYHFGDLSAKMADSYMGEAWGNELYDIYNNSRIVINRHGEVAEGYSNNMRLFESTGCGALLFTESSKNIDYYFKPNEECITYDNTDDLVQKVQYYLEHAEEAEKIAMAGYARTMREHLYSKRLRPVADMLLERLYS